MLDDLERPYQTLIEQATHDELAKRRLDALERTLEEFEVLHNRTAVAGMLTQLDGEVGNKLHAFFDTEDPQKALVIRMLTRFKQLQGKSAPDHGPD